jgi:hypothetical protein
MNDKEKQRQEQEQRIIQLRHKYVVKARRGMSGPDMHAELRSDVVGERALTDLQIAAIVAYAFHPFHNPHMEFKKGWDIDDPIKARVPL